MWTESVNIMHFRFEIIKEYTRIHFQISGASFESKLFPRAAALGERLWTNPTTGFYEAEPRMTQQNYRMMMRGIQADAIQVTFY